jgi:telomere length regulation protein
MHSVFGHLARILDKVDQEHPDKTSTLVSAAAGAISKIAGSNETRKGHLVAWLTSPGAGLGDGIGIRRAVVSAIALDKESIATVLEKSMNQFGDQLYVKHSPLLQQEGKQSLREPVYLFQLNCQ